MSRRLAREQVFKLLFQINFTHTIEEANEQIELYFAENTELEELDTHFILGETRGVLEYQDKIDTILEKYAEGWKISRMGRVDVAILRLAIYEIFYNPEIPIRVSINEAVELAKKFGEDSSPAFINGILGKIISEEQVDSYE
ncbi:MAG: transcription antitermination factor NusB [Epulopiscium sp.]|nr:transcription antitermination factor NusB [Candidatus Epulonipiscium sp.]